MTEEKKLYRSNTIRTIGGVCGGLAEHFNIDPVVVRAAFVLAALFGGGGVLIYIILWIVIPDKPNLLNNTANNDSINTDFNKQSTMENEFETKQQRRDKRNHHSNLTGGLILITLGILFLIDRFVPQVNFGDLWPVILIVIGITLLIRKLPKEKQ